METEVELTTDNQMIEKNVDIINKGATEAVAERQELHMEVANVDTVRSLDDRCLDQQINVRRRRNLKKRTQGNRVSRKEPIAVHTRVTRHAVPAVSKGNKRKRPRSDSSARRIAESRTASVETEIRPEFRLGIDDRAERERAAFSDEGEDF
jgi:hypothetical protein